MALEKFIRQTGRRTNEIRGPGFVFGKYGRVSINRLAYTLLKEPHRITVYVDREAGLLGLHPAEDDDTNAYKVTVQKSGGAEISVRGLYLEVEAHYSSPIRAVARFHDRILAAPVLPRPVPASPELVRLQEVPT